jgi:hypothetical protein
MVWKTNFPLRLITPPLLLLALPHCLSQYRPTCTESIALAKIALPAREAKQVSA